LLGGGRGSHPAARRHAARLRRGACPLAAGPGSAASGSLGDRCRAGCRGHQSSRHLSIVAPADRFTVLLERDEVPRGEDLDGAYGGAGLAFAPGHAPQVAVNVVSTLDGVLAFDGSDSGTAV